MEIVTCSLRTYVAKPKDIEKDWFVIDAAHLVLGALRLGRDAGARKAQADLHAKHGLRRSHHYRKC